MKTELAVIKALSEHDGLTINAISKLLKKPYATVNKYVHELIAQKIIAQQAIGNAIFCKLNNTEEVLGWLVLLRTQRTQKELKKNPELNKIYSDNETQVVILDNDKTKVMHDSQLKKGMTVMRNHERYWRLVR